MKLKEGVWYDLYFWEKTDSKTKKKVKKRMQLVRCYTHHAVFRTVYGYCVSYRYWDLERLMRGELME